MRSGKGKEEIYENTLLITRWLESAVQKYPDQWNWMNLHWAAPKDSSTRKTEVKEFAWDRKGESGAK
jgi:lauroyl/myristoyl acyltransferase